MSDRLIFRLKHDGETLAYLYQNWGMGDGAEIERLVRKAATDYNLDLTKRADAIQAVRIAGEEQYGHALWTANEGEKDSKWLLATAEDRAYLMAHRREIIADNQDEHGIVFFYGTHEGYPAYIEGWCEDAYTMTV